MKANETQAISIGNRRAKIAQLTPSGLFFQPVRTVHTAPCHSRASPDARTGGTQVTLQLTWGQYRVNVMDLRTGADSVVITAARKSACKHVFHWKREARQYVITIKRIVDREDAGGLAGGVDLDLLRIYIDDPNYCACGKITAQFHI